MKKIVALVLSLVMALSLCTVAFAADDAVYVHEDGVAGDFFCKVSDLTTVKAYTAKDDTKLSNIKYYVLEDGETFWEVANDIYGAFDGFATKADAEAFAVTNGWTEGTNSVTSYTVDLYLIPCTEDDADLAMYKNHSYSEYLMISYDSADAFYNAKGVAQKETSAKPNCTTDQFFADGYLCTDGCHFYVADDNSSYKLNVDGKIVFVTDVSKDADYVVWASHVLAKGVKNDKTGYDVATCLICKGEFACTNSLEVATKNGYKISTGFAYSTDAAWDVYNENYYENGYDFAWGQTYANDYLYCWQLKAGTTEEIGTADKTETTTTTGVESAKTFDAGIAMYVGMSLMSVAGTAVVIGKKKEF